MRLWTGFWLSVVVLVATFAAVNWPALSSQAVVNLLVTQVTAPIGLVMLGAMVMVALLFLIFLVWLETKALVQTGRAVRSSSASDAAMVKLRTDLDEQLTSLRAQTSESVRAVIERIDRLERGIKDDSERTKLSIGAHVSRLEAGLKSGAGIG